MLRVLVGDAAARSRRAGARRRRSPRRAASAPSADAARAPGRARTRGGSRARSTGTSAPVSSRSSRRAAASGALAGLDAPGHRLPEAAARLAAAQEQHAAVGADRDDRDRAQVRRRVRARAPERLGDVAPRAAPRPPRAAGTARPRSASSAARLVTPSRGSAMPHGTITWKCVRSVRTLNAKPCDVTQRERCTPTAPIFLRPTHAPRCSSCRARLDAVVGAGADHRLLERGHVAAHVGAVGEVERPGSPTICPGPW